MSSRFLFVLVFVLGASVVLASPLTHAADRGNVFNPKISLILDSLYAQRADNTPADIAGVLRSPDSDFATQGFSLGETELVAESNIDDQWHGWATLSLAPEGGISVEEAYANTLALPYGLAAKIGRFKSELGYQNHVHAHAWDFVDAPLAYRALLNTQVQDDGVQLRWVAPTDLLLEIGGEALRGSAFPNGGDNRGGVNAFTGFLHLGGDAGKGGSWRIGLSHLHGNADKRATGDATTNDDVLFTGTNDVSVADFVFKWAPGGNNTITNLVVTAEYFHGRELGDLTFDQNPGPSIASAYQGLKDAAYGQIVYQFMPRWRAGVRYDWLTSNNRIGTPAPANASFRTLADNSLDPQRGSVMVDFSNSEFSRIRVQYNSDATRPGPNNRDDQFYVQFIYSLGAHPAHQY